jgi:hypothetical protein
MKKGEGKMRKKRESNRNKKKRKYSRMMGRKKDK